MIKLFFLIFTLIFTMINCGHQQLSIDPTASSAQMRRQAIDRILESKAHAMAQCLAPTPSFDEIGKKQWIELDFTINRLGEPVKIFIPHFKYGGYARLCLENSVRSIDFKKVTSGQLIHVKKRLLVTITRPQ